jgi:hypothetical protein
LKVRLRASSTGSLSNYTWARIYIVEVKTFLFWNKVDSFESYSEACDCMDKFGKPSAVVYEY